MPIWYKLRLCTFYITILYKSWCCSFYIPIWFTLQYSTFYITIWYRSPYCSLCFLICYTSPHFTSRYDMHHDIANFKYTFDTHQNMAPFCQQLASLSNLHNQISHKLINLYIYKILTTWRWGTACGSTCCLLISVTTHALMSVLIIAEKWPITPEKLLDFSLVTRKKSPKK